MSRKNRKKKRGTSNEESVLTIIGEITIRTIFETNEGWLKPNDFVTLIPKNPIEGIRTYPKIQVLNQREPITDSSSEFSWRYRFIPLGVARI